MNMATLPYKFGRYSLERLIASGGMAEIFEARYFGESGFAKKVAVKRILPSRADSHEFREMFVDEARALMDVTHQNIVQVFELGRDKDTYFISMEFVDGSDLKRLIGLARRAHRIIPLDVACYIVSEVLRGLEHIHKKGIVHRDISPQNIMVSHSGEVKITDFGIARGKHCSRDTTVGTLKGKFSYMSPEQAMGEAIDARSDIYSLGLVLYELLTQEKMFDDDGDMKLLSMVQRANFLPTWMDKVPECIRNIMNRALDKNASERFQSAGEFLCECREQVPIAHSSALAGFLSELSEGTEESFVPQRWKATLMMKPPATRMAGKLLRICASLAAISSLATVGWVKEQDGVNVSAGAEASIIQTPEAAPILNEVAEGTLSVRARPWGEVTIPGVINKKEAPLLRMKLKEGDYSMQTYFAPRNMTLKRNVHISSGADITCYARFDKKGSMVCK